MTGKLSTGCSPANINQQKVWTHSSVIRRDQHLRDQTRAKCDARQSAETDMKNRAYLKRGMHEVE